MPVPPDLSAHIGYLFSNLVLERRFEAARRAGFEAVEHPNPYELTATECSKLLDATGLRMVQISSGLGREGEKGMAALHGREAEFEAAFAEALDYAEEIGCPLVHAMAGIGGSRSVYLSNLERAAKLAEGRQVDVLIEAISHTAVPRYHADNFLDLVEVARQFDGRVRLLLDTFHVSAVGVELSTALARSDGLVGHIHIADYPTRAEPGTGRLDFSSFAEVLGGSKYSGAVGFEYTPSPKDDFAWMAGFREELRESFSAA